jgi:hypothetical protein
LSFTWFFIGAHGCQDDAISLAHSNGTISLAGKPAGFDGDDPAIAQVDGTLYGLLKHISDFEGAKKNDSQPKKLGMFLLVEYLFPETEFLDQCTIAGEVVLAKVSQQSLTLPHELHQSAVGRKIFLVGLQVLGNVVDPLRQQGYLALD